MAERRTFNDTELSEIEALAQYGVPIKDMGPRFGLSPTYFAELSRKDEALRQAIEKGKSLGIEVGARWAYRKAFLIGAGDNTMAIFWLKTQAGWSEKTKLEVTGKDGGPIEMNERSIDEKIKELIERLGIGSGDAVTNET